MMTLEAKVNPFDGLKGGKEPEKVEDVKDGVDEKVELAVKQYDQNYGPGQAASISDIIADQTLQPYQIKQTFQLMQAKFDTSEPNFSDHISMLIQKSYDTGHNNFTLVVLGEIGNIGRNLKGQEDKRMHLLIDNPLNYRIFDSLSNAEFLNVDINGYAGIQLGLNSKSNLITVNGDVGNGCGARSICTYIHVKGKADSALAFGANDSTFTVDGDIGDFVGSGSKNCKFQTPNKKTYEKMNNGDTGVLKGVTNGEVIYTGK